MKHIVRALRLAHKNIYRQYQRAASEKELFHLQAVQNVIEKFLPGEIEKLMNAHLPKTAPQREWFFSAWVEKIRNR